MENAVSKFDM